MKTRRFALLIGLFLVLILAVSLAGACSQPAPAPSSSAPAPAASSAPSAPPKTSAPAPAPSSSAPAPAPSSSAPAAQIKLSISTTTAATAPPGKMLSEWASKLEAATAGKVKCSLYFSSSLFAPEEALRSVLGGVADMQFAYSGREDPGLMVLNYFYTLPFIGFPNSTVGTQVYADLVSSFPGFKEEYQGLRVYAPLVYTNKGFVHTTKKQVLKMADFKGMRVIADGLEAKWVELMGGTPVNVPFPDRYTSLEKGLVEADMSSFGPIAGMGTIDLYKFHTVLNTCSRTGYVCTIMNPKTLANLPPDVLKAINDLEPWLKDTWVSAEAATDENGLKTCATKGHTVATLSDEETKAWAAIAQPLHQQWIKDVTAKGKPGQKFYDTLKELIAKYSAAK